MDAFLPEACGGTSHFWRLHLGIGPRITIHDLARILVPLPLGEPSLDTSLKQDYGSNERAETLDRFTFRQVH